MKRFFITMAIVMVLLLSSFVFFGVKATKAIEEKGLHTILVELWEGNSEE